MAIRSLTQAKLRPGSSLPLTASMICRAGIVLAHHGAEADLALLVAAVELAAPYDGELARSSAEAAHQEAGGAAGGAIVDADVSQTLNVADIRAQGDYGDAGANQFVDGFADQLMVERLEGDAGAASMRAIHQLIGERCRIHALDERDAGLCAAAFAGPRNGVSQHLGRAAGVGGQEDVEGCGVSRPAAIDGNDLADGLFDRRNGLLAYAAASIDDAIDGSSADAGAGRYLGDARPASKQGLFAAACLARTHVHPHF